MENKKMTKSMVKLLIAVGVIIVILVLFWSLFTTRIPTGYTGVLTTFGRVEDKTLNSGLMVKSPFQKVILIDNRIQKTNFTTQAFSSDIQQVQIVGSASYKVEPETAMDLYRRVGQDYVAKLVEPRLWENAKAVFSGYTAEKLIATRDTLSEEIAVKMNEDLKAYGITVVSIAVEDIDFSDVFTDAVEAKQVAEQQKLRAATEQQQKTMETEQAAERQRIEAQAKADVKRIEAEAEAYAKEVQAAAEAEANQKIAASLTDQLVDYQKINRWDGKMPTIMGGSGITPIVDVAEVMQNTASEAKN